MIVLRERREEKYPFSIKNRGYILEERQSLRVIFRWRSFSNDFVSILRLSAERCGSENSGMICKNM